jgi:plasmid maintenance system killer protein
MPRVRIDPPYVKDHLRLSPEIRKQATKALRKFVETPKLGGLHFEHLKGWPGYCSIRVNRGYRILLREESDAQGKLYAAVGVGPHSIYRR